MKCTLIIEICEVINYCLLNILVSLLYIYLYIILEETASKNTDLYLIRAWVSEGPVPDDSPVETFDVLPVLSPEIVQNCRTDTKVFQSYGLHICGRNSLSQLYNITFGERPIPTLCHFRFSLQKGGRSEIASL